MTTPAATVKEATADTRLRFRPPRVDFANFKPRHFIWQFSCKVATITLNRPERKNPLTLESYAELRDTFRDLVYAEGIKSVVLTGAGGNFCSGGDVHDIIGPLVQMQRHDDMAGLLAFTRMTGDLVKAMRACPQPIVAAVDGICAGPAQFWPWPPICVTGRRGARSPSFSCGLGLLAPTWVLATCCRESSVRVAPPSFSIWAAP